MRGVRWILAMAAFVLSLVLVLIGYEAAVHYLRMHFCEELNSTWDCIRPSWIDSAAIPIFTILGSGLAAILGVISGSIASPSRRKNVPWMFFAIGAIPILFLTGLFLGPVMDHEAHLMAGAASAITGGFFAAKTLIKKGIFSNNGAQHGE